MSKAESVEQEVKVEWDPERYEESMAAILAWVPKGVEVKLLESQVLIGNPNIRLGQDYPFDCSGLLSCQYEINQGLIFLFSGEPYLQAIKEDETVLPHTSRLFAWELCHEQVEHLEFHDSSVNALSLFGGNIIHCKSLSRLKKLTSLTIKSCKSLVDISGLIRLKKLTSLDLSYCSALVNINGLNGLSQLTSLDLSSCNSLVDISDLSELRQLTSLNLKECKSLSDISPVSKLKQLTWIGLNGCNSLAVISALSGLNKLTKLYLYNCNSLLEISGLSGLNQLTELRIDSCESLVKINSLSGLNQLTELYIDNCSSLVDISGLSELSQLVKLEFYYCSSLVDVSALSSLHQLTKLELYGSSSLVDISALSGMNQLTSLNLSSCESLADISALSGLTQLTSLDLNSCFSLVDISALSGLTQLTSLNLYGCQSLVNISGISGLNQLTSFDLSSCKSLVSISGISGLTQLTSLDLSYCESLVDISGLSELTQLTDLDLSWCQSLVDISALSGLTQLTSLNLIDCRSLVDISTLSGLNQLTKLDLDDCGEIVTLEPLRKLTNLKELTWITNSVCAEILLNGAISRLDLDYIDEFLDGWIHYFSLVKRESFFLRLLKGIEVLNVCERKAKFLSQLIEKSLRLNSKQVSIHSWRDWSRIVLSLPKVYQEQCFTLGLKYSNSETIEGRFAGLIGMLGQLANEKPQWALDLVENCLTQLSKDHYLAHLISSAAALFYALWGDQAKAKYWLEVGGQLLDLPWSNHDQTPNELVNVDVDLVSINLKLHYWLDYIPKKKFDRLSSRLKEASYDKVNQTLITSGLSDILHEEGLLDQEDLEDLEALLLKGVNG